jgi:hypothetical protein
MNEKNDSGVAIESTPLLACPFCGETPTHQPPDHLGPFVWHSSPWCPIAAPVKFQAEVWNRRKQANAAVRGAAEPRTLDGLVGGLNQEDEK